ncbi:MAG: hypothetical protein ABW169_05380, partial [Sphingobium sp.]
MTCLWMVLACSAPLHAQTPAAAPNSAPETADDTSPIIPDAEFDAAIPAIETDPNTPMGSVADWGKHAGGQTVLATPPVNDPDIDAPLTPLQAFDVEPFDDSRYTEADNSKPATVRYTYKLEGLDG